MNQEMLTIRVGDKVGLGPKHKKAQAYGIVKKITIQTTHIEYDVELTDIVNLQKKNFKSKIMKITSHQVRLENNDPDTIMKSIL